MFQHKRKPLFTLLLVLVGTVVMFGRTMGESSSTKEIEGCSEQLGGLATCLTYVSGQAKAPTPDCCSGLKQVLKSNKKCLCIVIKDRNDPELGTMQINVTLALNLPTACNSPANISKCPELLHMDPKSPDTQVFYQLEKGSTKSATSPAPTPSSAVGEKPSSSQATSVTTQKNAAFCNKSMFGLQLWAFGLLVWVLLGSATCNFFFFQLNTDPDFDQKQI